METQGPFIYYLIATFPNGDKIRTTYLNTNEVYGWKAKYEKANPKNKFEVKRYSIKTQSFV